MKLVRAPSIQVRRASKVGKRISLARASGWCGASGWCALLVFGVLIEAGSSRLMAQDAAVVDNAENAKRGFLLPAQRSEDADHLADFKRHCEKRVWERAFKSLDALLSADAAGMMPSGKDGIMLPGRALIRKMLVDLPPEGKQAYQLFHDADAKVLLAEGDAAPAGSPAELEKLTKAYTRHFITSAGDEAADRLGDVLFERGEVGQAINCWQAILDDHPETALPRSRLLAKIATGHARLGRWDAFNAVREEVNSRHAGESTVIAGRELALADYLETLAAGRTATEETPLITSIEAPTDVRLPEAIDTAWQFRMFEASDLAAMTNQGWGSRTFSDHVPPIVADESRVYVNLLGNHLALDLATGKLLWRSGRFHDLVQKIQQSNYWFPEQYWLTLSGGHLWSIFGDPNGNNGEQPGFRLARLDKTTGKETWNSSSVTDLAAWGLTGRPLAWSDRVFVAARKNDQTAELYLLALRIDDGKLLWSTHLGTHQSDPNEAYYERSAQAELLLAGDRLLVETHLGALLQLDPNSGEIRWAYAYDSEVFASNFFFYDRPRKRRTAAAPLLAGGRLYFKGMRSSRLNAIDLDGPGVAWTRPISQGAMLAGIDGERMYLGGEELTAIDLDSRKLLWSTRLPPCAPASRPLVTRDRLYQFTSRGVFEIDKSNGDVVRQFRGADLGSLGGTLHIAPDRLITVSNLSITAYDLKEEPASDAGN